MNKEIRLVIGNHWNYWGIDHIVNLLRNDLLNRLDAHISQFPGNDCINIFIEDFSSSNYLKLIKECKGQKVLICTEFLSGDANKIKINSFKNNYLADTFYIFKVYRNKPKKLIRALYLISKKMLSTLIFFGKGLSYWRNRTRGLKELIDLDIFDLIVSLHPDCLTDLTVNKANFTYYPIIEKPLANSILGEKKIVTMGSQNYSREAMINEINLNLPLSITHITFEEIEKSTLHDKSGFIDLYLPNSFSWKYTSPIRIANSICRGLPVILFRNYDFHPITSCCIQIQDIRELGKFEGKMVGDLLNAQIESYNQFASRSNEQIIAALESLQ